VLVPLALCGSAFSLIEAMAAALRGRGVDVPIYVLSPVAGACLTLANVMPEWVEPQRQVRAPGPQPSAPGLDIPPPPPPAPAPQPLAPSLTPAPLSLDAMWRRVCARLTRLSALELERPEGRPVPDASRVITRRPGRLQHGIEF